jgi:hypothetical protein
MNANITAFDLDLTCSQLGLEPVSFRHHIMKVIPCCRELNGKALGPFRISPRLVPYLDKVCQSRLEDGSKVVGADCLPGCVPLTGSRLKFAKVIFEATVL